MPGLTKQSTFFYLFIVMSTVVISLFNISQLVLLLHSSQCWRPQCTTYLFTLPRFCAAKSLCCQVIPTSDIRAPHELIIHSFFPGLFLKVIFNRSPACSFCRWQRETSCRGWELAQFCAVWIHPSTSCFTKRATRAVQGMFTLLYDSYFHFISRQKPSRFYVYPLHKK